MNKNLSPLTAFAVLSVLGLFLAGIYYFNQQALNVDRISLMAPHPDGSAVVMMGNDLYKIDPATTSEKVISLDALGITSTIGGFGFFTNGDLLIVADSQSSTFAQQMAVNHRSENTDYSGSGANQLLRCDLNSRSCKSFSQALPDFTRTFRVHVDHPADTVFVADTSRHRLMKLDSNGNQLAIRSSFKFPNQLRRIEGELWVSDTNHHLVKRLDDGVEKFGDVKESRHTELLSGHRWPSDIVGVEKGWWVLVMDYDMRDGIVLRYDSDWKQNRFLPLPPGADPMALLNVGNSVLVTDYGKFALYRFDHNGERLKNFQSPALQAALDSAHAEYRINKLAWLAVWVVFVVSVVIGFVYAIKSIPEVFEPIVVNQGAPLVEIPEAGIWLKTRLLVRISRWFFLFLMVVLVLLSVLLAIYGGDTITPAFWVMVGLTIVVSIPFEGWNGRRVKGKLGLFPEEVVYMSSDGFQHAEKYSELIWAEGSIKVGPNVIPIPHRSKRGLFPTQPIKNLLIPRLQGDRHVHPRLMLKYQFMSPDKSFQGAWLVVAFFGIALLLREIWEICY